MTSPPPPLPLPTTWLYVTAGGILTLVHVGGVTRLTQSGLSMTHWSVTGSLPPRTLQEWEEEFQRYQSFPEYQQRNKMTLSEFQTIYYWEYAHRMLGRTVGVLYCVPWMYYSVIHKGMFVTHPRGPVIPMTWQPRLALLATMGATQGAVGWWMVQSGLGDDRRHESTEIRVRPVRLMTHLGLAVTTYAAVLWTAWGMGASAVQQQPSLPSWTAAQRQGLQSLRVGSFGVVALTMGTILSGALVAGNDAGRAYNTFPTMDGSWFPFSSSSSSSHTDRDDNDRKPYHVRNFLSDTTTVQWNHRVLATTTAVAATTLVVAALRLPITGTVRRGVTALGVTVAAQYGLGVATLLNTVPIELAAAHQLGSMALLTSGLYTAFGLQRSLAAAATVKGIVRKVAQT